MTDIDELKADLAETSREIEALRPQAARLVALERHRIVLVNRIQEVMDAEWLDKIPEAGEPWPTSLDDQSEIAELEREFEAARTDGRDHAHFATLGVDLFKRLSRLERSGTPVLDERLVHLKRRIGALVFRIEPSMIDKLGVGK